MKTRLTFQQAEALRLFLLGYCRTAAARDMDIEPCTFSGHLHGARRRLHGLTLKERGEVLREIIEPGKSINAEPAPRRI